MDGGCQMAGDAVGGLDSAMTLLTDSTSYSPQDRLSHDQSDRPFISRCLSVLN